MKKTLKWIVVMAVPMAIIMIVPAVAVGSMTETDTFDNPDATTDAVTGFAALSYLIYIPIRIAAPVYFMFRWTTEYDLTNFGHKSRCEWERA